MEECLMEWASESNSFTCAYVYKQVVQNVDLGGLYFEGAVPIVETQVARGNIYVPYPQIPVILVAICLFFGLDLMGSGIEVGGIFEFVGYWKAWLG